MLSIEEIELLEDESKWEKAREALMERFHDQPNDEQILIRLGFLCWYVLVEWGCITVTEDMDESVYIAILKEVTETGLNNFADNPHFL